MAEFNPTLKVLAETISQTAKAITSYLDAHDIPTPSFAEDSPTDYPSVPEVQGPRLKLIEALSDMMLLAMGPTDFCFMKPIYSTHDAMSLDILNQFDFFSAIPLGGSATYSDIARATTLPESIVHRVLRYAAAMRLFAEGPSGSGTIIHTASSAFLAKNHRMRSWLSHNLEELRVGALYTPESLRKYSAGKERPSEEVLESGFAIADIDKTGHRITFWDYIQHTPEGKPEGFRAKRFAEAMQATAMASATNPDEVVKRGFDWDTLGQATVVDVGGSSGHIATLLAKEFPKLNLVVQDLPEVQKAFQAYVPHDLTTRVTFQPHDFFNPQSMAAEVYFLKSILHDWPDKYAIEILRNLLPNLKPGGRIVLCEIVSPPAQVPLPRPVRQIMSAADLQMLVAFNSLDRTMEDWQALAKQADERLDARLVSSFPGSPWGIVEIVLKN